jgi:hypothetical protein
VKKKLPCHYYILQCMWLAFNVEINLDIIVNITRVAICFPLNTSTLQSIIETRNTVSLIVLYFGCDIF